MVNQWWNWLSTIYPQLNAGNDIEDNAPLMNSFNQPPINEEPEVEEPIEEPENIVEEVNDLEEE